MSTTEEKTEEKEVQIFEISELHDMFNTSFLPMLQEFARRTKEKKLNGKDVEFFNVQMILQFSELEAPLTYDHISDKIQMQLQPFTKEDLEKAKNDGNTDCGDE